MTLYYVCRAPMLSASVTLLHCSTCKRRRRCWTENNGWYGWNVTCLTCGEGWCDGERLERPFKPRWRQESIAAAHKRMELAKRERVPKELTQKRLEECIGTLPKRPLRRLSKHLQRKVMELQPE